MEALNDLWIVGDKFANESLPYLQQLKPELHNRGLKPLYIQENFLVTAFTASQLSIYRSPISRLRNCVAEGFNTNNKKMPKLILLLIDTELVRFTPIAERVITWLFTEIRLVITARKDQLPAKAKVFDQPKVIVIKPVI